MKYILKYLFLVDILFWGGVTLDLEKYIFPW